MYWIATYLFSTDFSRPTMDKIDKEAVGLGLSILATGSTALFAGACSYINRVEHPARMTHDSATAITIFTPSCQRAQTTQVRDIVFIMM